MKKEEGAKSYHEDKSRKGKPYRVRLPGFVTDKEVGLGDVIKRVTSSIGIKPCTGCKRRAAALNRRFVFTGRHSR